MSSVYRAWVDRLDNYSVRQKLFMFESVFFLSRIVPSVMVALLQAALERSLPFPHPFPFPINLLGIPVTVVAVAVDIWSIGNFLTIGAGTPAPMRPPSKVVMAGPYKYVRNPMYLDIFLTALGLAILFDSILLLAVDVAALIVIHFVVVLPEEKKLEVRFGPEYLVYKSKVPRWVPSFRI